MEELSLLVADTPIDNHLRFASIVRQLKRVKSTDSTLYVSQRVGPYGLMCCRAVHESRALRGWAG